jgi:hypothetical protein
LHSALKEFFAAHPKARLDPAALDDVQALCRAAERAGADLEGRIRRRTIMKSPAGGIACR